MSGPDAESPQLCSGHAGWKSWRGEFASRDREARRFAAERADLPPGFGNGSFLAWAKAQGAGPARYRCGATFSARSSIIGGG